MSVPMLYEDDVSEWIRDYACDVRDLFGLSEWRLWLKLADTPSGKEYTDGSTELSTRYLKATITIRRALEDDDRIRHVVMHEMTHVLLGYIDQCVNRLIDMVPDEQREHALELYTDAEEQTIERLTRALQVGVRPKEVSSD